MSAIAFLEPLARIVVATLFNSLWEGALLAVAVWALLSILPNINATTRYVAWTVALIAALVLPVVTSLPQISVETTHIVASTTTAQHVSAPAHTTTGAHKTATIVAPRATTTTTQATRPVTLGRPLRLHFAVPTAVALGIFAAWILAALFLLIRLVFNLSRLEALKRDALPLSLDYREHLSRWTKAEKGGRDVRLCVSDGIEVPVAVGLFDSMVLIPKHLLDTLTEYEIDQITLHELAHLRRADDWTNGLQRIIQAIFFFNPAILFIAQQLDLEREVACDDWVLYQTGDVRPYATCLTRMAEVTAWPHRALAAPGVFMTRRGLSVRVERLLRAGRNARVNLSFGPAGAVGAALIVLFFIAQTVAPSFAFTSRQEKPIPTVAKQPAKHPAKQQPVMIAQRSNTPVVQRVIERQVVQGRPIYRTVYVTVTPAPNRSSNRSTSTSSSTSRSRYVAHAGFYDGTWVNVPPVHVNVPEVNVRVPEMNVRVPEVNVHVPAVHVNVPAYHYHYQYLGYGKHVASVSAGMNCTGCDFRGAQLAGRNLSNVNLTGADFRNADLHGANLSLANLQGADFSGANLRDVNFMQANLQGCDMRRADLTGANFTSASLEGCNITISSLAPAQARAILNSCQGCDFRAANLRGQDLHGVSLSGDDLSYADLRDADMRNANFSGVDFKHARFDGAKLDGAQFSGCDLTGVNLRNVDLTHTQFSGSKLDIMR